MTVCIVETSPQDLAGCTIEQKCSAWLAGNFLNHQTAPILRSRQCEEVIADETAKGPAGLTGGAIENRARRLVVARGLPPSSQYLTMLPQTTRSLPSQVTRSTFRPTLVQTVTQLPFATSQTSNAPLAVPVSSSEPLAEKAMQVISWPGDWSSFTGLPAASKMRTPPSVVRTANSAAAGLTQPMAVRLSSFTSRIRSSASALSSCCCFSTSAARSSSLPDAVPVRGRAGQCAWSAGRVDPATAAAQRSCPVAADSVAAVAMQVPSRERSQLCGSRLKAG